MESHRSANDHSKCHLESRRSVHKKDIAVRPHPRLVSFLVFVLGWQGEIRENKMKGERKKKKNKKENKK